MNRGAACEPNAPLKRKTSPLAGRKRSQLFGQGARFAPAQFDVSVTFRGEDNAALFDSRVEVMIAGDGAHIDLLFAAVARRDGVEGPRKDRRLFFGKAPQGVTGKTERRQCDKRSMR